MKGTPLAHEVCQTFLNRCLHFLDDAFARKFDRVEVRGDNVE